MRERKVWRFKDVRDVGDMFGEYRDLVDSVRWSYEGFCSKMGVKEEAVRDQKRRNSKIL